MIDLCSVLNNQKKIFDSLNFSRILSSLHGKPTFGNYYSRKLESETTGKFFILRILYTYLIDLIEDVRKPFCKKNKYFF